MNKKTIITALLALVTLAGKGQTDTKGGILSGMETDVQPFDFSKPMMADSLHFQQIIQSLELLQDFQQKPLTCDRTTSFPMPADKPFKLWSGASIIVYGGNNQMLGLMDAATGAMSLHQDFGRLHLTGSAVANKYWMPMQSQLYTQYGIGGSLGYDLTDAVSLHAFGYYYANNPHVSPLSAPTSAQLHSEAMPISVSARTLAVKSVCATMSILCRVDGRPRQSLLLTSA